MNAREAPDGVAAVPGLVEAVFGKGQQPIVDRGIILIAIEHRAHVDEPTEDVRYLQAARPNRNADALLPIAFLNQVGRM